MMNNLDYIDSTDFDMPIKTLVERNKIAPIDLAVDAQYFGQVVTI
jgi:hypothetical protein